MQEVASRPAHLTIPNLLTLSRIVMIPVFVLIYFLRFDWSPLVAAIIFSLAGATDWIDGYLARKWGQMTKLGAFLDTVADKLMVAVALVALVEGHNNFLLTIPPIAIIGLIANAPDVGNWVVWLAYLLLYAATVLTLWSMLLYLKAAWPDLKE